MLFYLSVINALLKKLQKQVLSTQDLNFTNFQRNSDKFNFDIFIQLVLSGARLKLEKDFS